MYAVFKVHMLTDFYQSLEILKISFLKPLITGKTSISHHWLDFICFLFFDLAPPALPHRLQCSTIGRLVLTVVFGMGTGVSPKRIATRNIVIQFP